MLGCLLVSDANFPYFDCFECFQLNIQLEKDYQFQRIVARSNFCYLSFFTEITN